MCSFRLEGFRGDQGLDYVGAEPVLTFGFLLTTSWNELLLLIHLYCFPTIWHLQAENNYLQFFITIV